jgi:hypothetical protein
VRFAKGSFMTNSIRVFIEHDATLGRTDPWVIDRHYPERRRPELGAIRDTEERLPPGKSILLIGVLSLLSWLTLISVAMALWETVQSAA